MELQGAINLSTLNDISSFRKKNKMRPTIIFGIVCLTLLQSCSPKHLSQAQKTNGSIKSASENFSDLFYQYQLDHQMFSGLIVVDAQSDKVLFAQNADKLFTPASNTKLLTLLAAQYYLSDSIPALQYFERGDSLVIKGTGDPSFLTKNDVDSIAFHFLNQTDKSIYIDNSEMSTGRFGSGWAWDDYAYYYQKENSAFPMAGQATRISCHPDSTTLAVSPAFMENYIKIDTTLKRFLTRGEYSNLITINPLYKPKRAREYEIPFYQDSSFRVFLFKQLVDKELHYLSGTVDYPYKKLYHMNSDSLYKELMLNSDNFVAEQLLFVIGSQLKMELNTQKIIKRILQEEQFASIPDRPRWVDGSGLSRYNLTSPRSMIWILDQLDNYLTNEQIQQWFPSGEHLGTLPKGLEKLNIRAKTGTLSNNFCLSGYLYTDSGKRLRFSWMNNHFMASKTELVADMEKLLLIIQEEF